MLSGALDKPPVQQASAGPAPLVKTIRQDPRHIVAGKLRVLFRASEIDGAPEALRLGDSIFTVERRATQATRRDGTPATAIHYEVTIPPFTIPGAVAAEMRVGAVWHPLTLFVLVALH